MREHQIVISLKSEHFQQVQRMARATGSKSVSVFVRQRLLTALGLEGQEQASEMATGPDWQHISGQLRRLHRELQVFIAESLTASESANPAEPPMFIVPEENFITEGAPILVEYNPAHRAYMEQKQAQQRYEQPPRQPGQPAPPPAKPLLDASSDEMEQLAERAFAISPRLGAIEAIPAQSRPYDPLSDLLEDGLVRKAAGQPEVDDEEEELAPSEEEEVAPTPGAQHSEFGDEEFAQDDEETYSDPGAGTEEEDDDAVFGAGTQDSADDDISQQSGSTSDVETDEYDDEETAEIDDQEEDDEGEAEEPDTTSPPPPPPPISGGPPPRKRLK